MGLPSADKARKPIELRHNFHAGTFSLRIGDVEIPGVLSYRIECAQPGEVPRLHLELLVVKDLDVEIIDTLVNVAISRPVVETTKQGDAWRSFEYGQKEKTL